MTREPEHPILAEGDYIYLPFQQQTGTIHGVWERGAEWHY
jgi:hypothetical protein